MDNFFEGFRQFQEQAPPGQGSPGGRPEKPKGKFLNIIKKQAHVPKKLWMGMPIVLSNVKLGETLIRDPKVFYVTEFDKYTVTIRNVRNPMEITDDPDDEIDIDKHDFSQKEFTIPRRDFEMLLEPPPTGDYQSASGAIQWRQA